MDIKLIVFPPKLSRFSEAIEVSNKCYEFWQGIWAKVYAEAGSEAAFKLDDFYRQDFIGALFQKNDPIGLWMSSSFNLASHAGLHHSYFKFYNSDFKGWLHSRGIQDVMSVEFMTVDPELRSSKLGVSLGRVIAGLTTKALSESPSAQALVATARTDVAAANVAYEVGYECVEKGTLQRNFVCDLIACRKENIKVSPDHEANQVVKKLWSEKIDWTPQQMPATKAA